MRKLAFLPIFSALLFIVCLTDGCHSRDKAPQDEKRDQAAARSTDSPAPPAAPEQAPPTPQAPDDRPVIVTFGDSLTQGVAGKSYPAYLQDELDAHGYVYRVDNQGVSGDTSTDGLARIDNVIGSHPKLVVLEFGGNDGLRGVPVESTKANLDGMITKLKDAKIPLVLAGITLPPNYGPDYVGPFTAMFPELARKYRLRFLPFLLIHVYQHSDMMQPDGIHPNGAGNKVVAADVFGLIQPMLSQNKKRP